MTDANAILSLNAALTHTLTGINQYFLHARMLKHQGVMALADYEYKQSIDAMKYADALVERVLALGGIPNLQDLGRLMIGETVEGMLANDFTMQERALAQIRAAHAECQAGHDRASAELLSRMIASAEEHVNFIRSQPSANAA